MAACTLCCILHAACLLQVCKWCAPACPGRAYCPSLHPAPAAWPHCSSTAQVERTGRGEHSLCSSAGRLASTLCDFTHAVGNWADAAGQTWPDVSPHSASTREPLTGSCLSGSWVLDVMCFHHVPCCKWARHSQCWPLVLLPLAGRCVEPGASLRAGRRCSCASLAARSRPSHSCAGVYVCSRHSPWG